MRIAITGATGLVGRRLTLDRIARGDEVVVISRHGRSAKYQFPPEVRSRITAIGGNPAIPGPWQAWIDGCDAVVHLAAANVFGRRWSSRHKRVIRESRVDGTYQVQRAIAEASHRPRVLVSASAIGFYGETGVMQVDERSRRGDDELAQIVVDWEEQALRASTACRVVCLRLGLVLDRKGGVLGRMLPLFRLALGGRLGNGRQFMSWIAWQDVVGLVDFALDCEELRGVVNATAPGSVTNRVFTQTLGRVLGRPALLPAPRPMLRLALGEFARYVLMSQRVHPSKAIDAGYRFQHPDLEEALDAVLSDQPLRGAGGPVRRTAPVRPVRLVAVDLDGAGEAPAEPTAEIVSQLDRLHDAGCVPVLTTSLPPRSARRWLRACESPPVVIACDGAAVIGEGGATFAKAIPTETAVQIWRDLQTADERLAADLDLPGGRFHCVRGVDDGAIPEGIADQPVLRMRVTGPDDAIESAHAIVRDTHWRARRVAMFSDRPQQLDIVHPLADRGIAIQHVCRRAGVGRDETLAVGCGPRAAGLVEWAGFSAACGTCGDRVLELADVHVPRNGAEGLRDLLDRFVLHGEGAVD
jgi:uncharacterized protein (TIGR01777 family)